MIAGRITIPGRSGSRHRILQAVRAIILAAVLAVAGGAARSDDGVTSGGLTPNPSATEPRLGSWIDWNGDHFFGPCAGDCALAVLSGRELDTALTDIAGRKIRPWDWKWGPSVMVSTVFSRRLVTFWDRIEIVPEIGIGRRFGADAKAAEAWSALGFFWTAFPWNDYLRTRAGLATGPNLATQIDHGERLRSGRTGSVLLWGYSPEVDFSLPQLPAYELAISLHHRSGLIRLINHVPGGMQYFEFGLRAHF